MLSLDTKLAALPQMKKATLTRLATLDIQTVRDLLFHFPSRYENYSEIVPIGQIALGEKCTVEGTVESIDVHRTAYRRMLLTEAMVKDDTGTIRIVWFNERFVEQNLAQGTKARFSGKVAEDKRGLVFTNPAYEKSSKGATHTGRLVPVYPETYGITSRFFRFHIAKLLETLARVPDPLPKELLDRLHLPTLARALRDIHFPESDEAALVARKRFAWDEMFLIQLKSLEVKRFWEGSLAPIIADHEKEIGIFIKNLPFELTKSQKQSVKNILDDLGRKRPMNRLLNGDVGSGKTIVAAIAAYAAALAGYQSAILAPTEVLARQHYESFMNLFGNLGIQVAFLTREYHYLNREKVSKASLVSAIAAGIPQIVIGTHAILEDKVRFNNLALIVVDEQHRFGVAQRAALQQRITRISDGLPDTTAHFLTMTATPIPRTLALAYFGSLDLSLLTDMPKDRKPIITKVAATDTDRETIYTFIRSEIGKGRQAFVIFPLVEESEALEDVKAATVEHERLSKEVFPDLSLGLLHGRMKAKEKESVMKHFKNGTFHILVSTSVVEVGIDIPNASIMMIEDADRFGLSQLHQFRGRVGRAEHQSYCFLLPGKFGSEENRRLQALARHASGFDIAEEDLKLRGPGSFFGTRQSGLPDIAMENLTNIRLVEIASKEAAALIATDPTLEKYPLLKKSLATFGEKIHLE
jgi:ATP-dependent DNA helicase RecG